MKVRGVLNTVKIDIVIPVYNEAHILKEKIKELVSFLEDNCSDDWKVIIIDNASIDDTFEIMKEISNINDRVLSMHLEEKGRGRALKHAWSSYKSDLVCYMDVDLSTDLKAFPEMIEYLKSNADIVVGSRLMPKSEIKRCLTRDVLSRGYNLMHRLLLRTRFSDAQCGFKGFTREAIDKLLPFTKNNTWFFDTELLLLGERFKIKIVEVPVKWVEYPETRVNIIDAIIEDVLGLLRIRWLFWFDKRFKIVTD